MLSIYLGRSSPLVYPSTLDRSVKKWGLWERESLAMPKFIFRDVARDLLHTAIFRLRNNMLKCCPVKNTCCEDLFDILLESDTEEELIKAIRFVLKKLFPDCQGSNRQIYDHFCKAVDKIGDWYYSVLSVLNCHNLLLMLALKTVKTYCENFTYFAGRTWSSSFTMSFWSL